MLLEYIVSKISGHHNNDKLLLVDKKWISDKSTNYPIEIELVLRNKSEIEKIEIVVHNKYIPKKISIYSGKTEEQYIGEVQFKNRKDDGQKYELKNIFLDEICSSLILSISECYIDIVDNTDSLVGIIDVKLYGKYLPTNDNEESVDPKIFGYSDTKNKIMDHKYSKEIVAMIDAIEKNKVDAVANEDFKLAKQAQLAVRQLKKSSKEMEELENDKNRAIEDEDFQRAHDLQDEITSLRSNILSSIEPKLLENTMPTFNEIHRPKNLFDENGEKEVVSKPKLYEPVDLSPTEVPSDPTNTFLRPPIPLPRKSTPTKRPSTNGNRKTKTWDIPLRPITTESHGTRKRTPSPTIRKISTASSTTSNISRRQRSLSIGGGGGTNKFLEKENMIVPAALNKRRSSSTTNETVDITEKSIDDITEEQVLSMIPPDSRPNVRMAIQVFGLETIAKLYSKHYENRKEAISEIRQTIDEMTTEKASRHFESINCLLSHMLKEPLYNVYKDSLYLWHHFCTSRLPTLRLDKNMNRVATETTEIIATRTLSSEKRLVNETLVTFRDASKLPNIAKAYGSRLLNSNSKNLKGRAVLMEIIIKLHGVPNDDIGLTASSIASFATKCIRTSDQQVRTIGKDIMMKLYKNGSTQVVQKEMNKFASSDSNNPTYQMILREIYSFDGNRMKPGKKKISFMV